MRYAFYKIDDMLAEFQRKFIFSPKIAEKYSNIKFQDNLTSKIRVIAITITNMAEQTFIIFKCAKTHKIASKFLVSEILRETTDVYFKLEFQRLFWNH